MKPPRPPKRLHEFQDATEEDQAVCMHCGLRIYVRFDGPNGGPMAHRMRTKVYAIDPKTKAEATPSRVPCQ